MTTKPKRIPICPACKSRDLARDACARWNIDTQEWEVSSVYDDVTCDDCGEETSVPDWIDADERLFNCCTDNLPPDWSIFAHLEIGGCKDDPEDPGHTLGLCDDAEAEFWTVYGRHTELDTCEALTDCVSKAEARTVAAELSALSGLEVKP